MKMSCEHEPHCSKPSSYGRIGQFAVIIDGTGKIIEIVMPDDDPKDCPYVCTECHGEARLMPIENKGEEKSGQAVMPLDIPAQQERLEV